MRLNCSVLAVVAGLVAWLAARPVLAANLTRGPYLQLPGQQSITIRWSTDEAASCALSIRPLDGPPRTFSGTRDTACAIPVTDLEPGTRYAYVPLADGGPLADEAVFRTDHPTLPFSFLAFGDSGSGGTRQYGVARTALRVAPPDFVLHTGDVVYEDGEAGHYDRKFFRPYRQLLRRLVLWPALGNHDVHAEDGAAWLAAFDTPANNVEGSERYYSFEHGNALVVVLDSNEDTSPGSAQLVFLAQQLAASTATWKFLVFHESIYSSGLQHGSDLQKRANLIPVLDAGGADVVFMGNEHDYERTHPLVADQLAPPGTGTVYVTTGGGGHSLHEAGTSAFTAYSESVFHLVRVAIDGGTLRAQMIREDGSIGDSFTLVKGEPGPGPRCGDGLVNQATEACDGADVFACAGPCADDCSCTATCGDGSVNAPAETCDGADAAACPGLCRSDCSCGDASRFVELVAVADTHLELGVDLADFGASPDLDIDVSPPSLAYLEFDLSGVTAPIVRGTLVLHSSNGSYDPGTVYPVADSGWLEGIGDGTVPGIPPLGLRWADVDSNADGEIDSRDQAPYRPDFLARLDGLVEVAGDMAVADVTAAVQSGPVLVSLAIRSDATNGVTYSSRESVAPGERPRLRLELGDPPPTTTTTSMTTTTTTTSTTTTTAPPAEVCDEPGDEDGDGLADCLDADCAASVACPAGCEDAATLAAVGCRLAGLTLEIDSSILPERLQRVLLGHLRRAETALLLAEERCAAGNQSGARSKLRVALRAVNTVRRRLGARSARPRIEEAREAFRQAVDLGVRLRSLRTALECPPAVPGG